MASVGDFKHIAVNGADDDEVIVAGASSREGAEEAPVRSAAPRASASPSAPPSGPTRAAAPRRKPDPVLEDLQTGPAPLAQRIVIVAACALIIVALVYYFAFMR